MRRSLGSVTTWAHGVWVLVASAFATSAVATSALVAIAAAPAACQDGPGVTVDRAWAAPADVRLTASVAVPGMASGPQGVTAPSPAAATLLSLGLPGAGQHVLGQRRKWLYLALEAVGWTVYLERRGAGAGYRDRYRDFAWENARLQGPTRADGRFTYYETLTKWTRSGAFDSDDGAPGLQPEPDATTFNGSIWALARQIYLSGSGSMPESDPGYQSALGYYEERAYGSPFLWDWSGNPGGRQELADLIEASDDRYRQATTALGAVLANHLISAVDAYVSARGFPVDARLRVMPSLEPTGGRWSAVLTVGAR